MPCEHFTEAWQQAQVWDSSPVLQGGTQLESTLLPLYRARMKHRDYPVLTHSNCKGSWLTEGLTLEQTPSLVTEVVLEKL